MKKILYVINIDWFFISHFLQVGLEMQNKEYEVHIACGISDRKEYLESLGFIVHSLCMRRDNISIYKEIKTFIQIYKVINLVCPNILELFTIKSVLYGGMISRFMNINKRILYITGLGHVFIKSGIKGVIVKFIVKLLYMLVISGKSTRVITENKYDKKIIEDLSFVDKSQIIVIKGAGVNLEQYNYVEENNNNKIVVVMASRLLKEKGVFEYIEAGKILKNKGLEVEFELYGDRDIGNPTTLTENDLEYIVKSTYVKVYGFNSEIEKIFSNANIIVLPSYREGLPRVLIEAAACGRAVVTTDVPGCKDAIVPNVTGLLCKVKNPQSLAKQIEKLILNRDLRNNMGKAARELAKNEFDINKIVQIHCRSYESGK